MCLLGLLTLLGTVDSLLVHKAYHSILSSGASTQLVFGFEVKLILGAKKTLLVANGFKLWLDDSYYYYNSHQGCR